MAIVNPGSSTKVAASRPRVGGKRFTLSSGSANPRLSRTERLLHKERLTPADAAKLDRRHELHDRARDAAAAGGNYYGDAGRKRAPGALAAKEAHHQARMHRISDAMEPYHAEAKRLSRLR